MSWVMTFLKPMSCSSLEILISGVFLNFTFVFVLLTLSLSESMLKSFFWTILRSNDSYPGEKTIFSISPDLPFPDDPFDNFLLPAIDPLYDFISLASMRFFKVIFTFDAIFLSVVLIYIMLSEFDDKNKVSKSVGLSFFCSS